MFLPCLFTYLNNRHPTHGVTVLLASDQGVIAGLVVGLVLALTASFGASLGGAPPPVTLPTDVDGCGFNVTLLETVISAANVTSVSDKSVPDQRCYRQ